MNRQVLLFVIGSLLLPLGCGGSDDPFIFRLLVITTSLRDGGQNVAYSERLTASGGDGDYTWSVAIGSLPSGLSLAASTGEISGKPTVVEASDFTVRVESDDQDALQPLSIIVNVAPVLQPSELCSAHPYYAIATFEDANLEAATWASLEIGAPEDLTCGLGQTMLDGATVSASNTGIESLVGIQNLTSLTGLHLDENSIIDISSLSGLTSLRVLSLFNNSITDISALSGLTSLSDLRLRSNSITDISALSGLTSLTFLGLRSNSITDINALSGLTSLAVLSLDNNSITDISALSGRTSLTEVHLQNNSITDISPLSGLTSLESLDLGGNSITDISPLSRLTSLESLDLGGNSITNINALRGLTILTFLFLPNNPGLTDIQALLDNVGLGAGDQVELSSTNVGCTDVAALEAKGVLVISDCP